MGQLINRLVGCFTKGLETKRFDQTIGSAKIFRNFIRTSILVFVIAAAGYSGYWLYARSVGERIVLEWIDARRNADYRIEHAPVAMDGFPFLVRATLDAPLVASIAPKDAAGWTWRAGQITVETLLWRLDQFRIDIRGVQTVTLTGSGVSPGAANPQIHRFVGETFGVTRLRQGQPENVAIIARKFNWRGPDGATLLSGKNLSMWAVAPKKLPEIHTDPLFSVSINGADLTLPDGTTAPFGRHIKSLQGTARVLGRVQLGAPEAAIEAWRRGGGTVNINNTHIIWGPLDMKISGTLALDDQARPLGAFTAYIRGFTHVVDALVVSGDIDYGAATMAKIGLGLLAKPAADGGPPVLSVPLTAQNGRLYAGPLKILNLPPLRLPVRLP